MIVINIESYTLGYIHGENVGYIDGIMSSGNNTGEVPDWIPPSNWINVPEPNSNEVYFLVTTEKTTQFKIINEIISDGLDVKNHYTVNWGDNTTDDIYLSNTLEIEHQYNTTNKQYLIKITMLTGYIPNLKSLILETSGSDAIYKAMLIVKYGRSMCMPDKPIMNNKGYKSCCHFKASFPYNKTTGFQSLTFRAITSMRNLQFYEPLTYIPDYFCYYCSNLIKLDLSRAVTIQSYAFSSCQNLHIDSVENVETLGIYAFQECCHITSIKLPKLLTLCQGTFANCKMLKELELPICTKVESYVFVDTSIKIFYLPLCVEVYSIPIKYVTQIILPCCTTLSVNWSKLNNCIEDVFLPMCADIPTYVFYDISIKNLTVLSTSNYESKIANTCYFENLTLV